MCREVASRKHGFTHSTCVRNEASYTLLIIPKLSMFLCGKNYKNFKIALSITFNSTSLPKYMARFLSICPAGKSKHTGYS